MLTKSMGSLKPDTDAAYKVLSSIKNGAAVVVDIKDPSRRSTRQHNFWFAIINELFEGQEYHKSFDVFRKLFLISLGRCDIHKTKTGDVPMAHSLAFGKMSKEDFQTLVDETLDFAVKLGFDRNSLEGEARAKVGY
ncbi:MAG: hypothetical protein KAS66_05475 [Candidatus Omnitrophica bacterium]|nr:hypothetical protein [Candidatus Omnitrophota bacterium]